MDRKPGFLLLPKVDFHAGQNIFQKKRLEKEVNPIDLFIQASKLIW